MPWTPPEVGSGDHVRYLWGTYFLGIQSVQYWSDFMVWDKFLSAHPEIGSMVELGTGRGGLSLYLYLEAIQREFPFLTFDTAPAEACQTPVAKLVGMSSVCITGDIFGDCHKRIITLLTSPTQPVMLFCDDGDKPKEFRTFVPYLKPGSLIAVHDWSTEFGSDDTLPVKDMVEETFVAESEAIGSMTRFYRRI